MISSRPLSISFRPRNSPAWLTLEIPNVRFHADHRSCSFLRRIKLKCVSVATVVGRIDHNLEVVVELLTGIPAKFCRNDTLWIRVVARNPEVDGATRVKDANLGLFSRWLSLIRLPLKEATDGLSRLPQRIVERAIQPWCLAHTHGLRDSQIALRRHSSVEQDSGTQCRQQK